MLADGLFHSGEDLGDALGISRSAVWKHLHNITEGVLKIDAVRGRGYRLARPLELLEEDIMRSTLSGNALQLLSGIEIHHDIDSTSAALMQMVARGVPSGYACFAERQRQGRGRHGRAWVSPYASNIYLSVLWNFPAGTDSVAGLSLATGVAVMRTVEEMGIDSAGLKWPNDIICEGEKLAGILLEMSGESSGPCSIVVGVGLNIRMPESAAAQIDQPWTDLESILNQRVSRNQAGGLLLHHLLLMLDEYQQQGLAPFLKEWRQHDILSGNQVSIHLAQSVESGVARGVDESGAMLVENNSGVLKRYISGEVSMRAHNTEI